jgi:hypothetical protein
MTIQEGFLFMMDILEICGDNVPDGCLEIAARWRGHLEWKKTLHDLFVLIPEENIYTVNTTTQAGMNISSGKLGIKRLAAANELNHSIDM